MRRIRLRLAVSLLAAAGLAATTGVAATGIGATGIGAATAGFRAPLAAGCNVAYTVNSDWGTGFTVTVTITNTGPAITSWTLGYSYSGNQKLVNGWNGNWTQSGQAVTVTNASWNGSLGTGQTAQPGAQFSYSGTNTAPTAFTLNGVACNQPVQPPPTVSLTSPTASQVFTPGSNITLAATAAAGGTGSIASVAFFESTSATSNTLIGTTTTSPYTVQWTNVAAGSYSLTAVATDNLGQTTTSSPVAITVAGPSVIVNPASLTVQQGSTGTFSVALSTQPAASVTVTVAGSGDPDLTAAPASLTFTTANWNTAQNVTITAGTNSADVGGHGTFTASATGYGSGTVSVTEAAKTSGYDQWFLSLYNQIKNPANGYFSPKGIPFHSVETLIVEAPDYGHETTSETYSYWLWLEADFGRVTGD